MRALMKSVNDKEPASTTIELLELLKKEAKPTEQMLRVSLLRRIAGSGVPEEATLLLVTLSAYTFAGTHHLLTRGANLGHKSRADC